MDFQKYVVCGLVIIVFIIVFIPPVDKGLYSQHFGRGWAYGWCCDHICGAIGSCLCSVVWGIVILGDVILIVGRCFSVGWGGCSGLMCGDWYWPCPLRLQSAPVLGIFILHDMHIYFWHNVA